jgi:hypothetical protein
VGVWDSFSLPYAKVSKVIEILTLDYSSILITFG